MDIFLQQVINGLTIGMIYALIALGYTMVYGIAQLINFAHGEIFMVGAYLGLLIYTVLHPAIDSSWALIPVFAGTMLLTALLGYVIERFAYRPLRNAPRL